MAVDRPTEKAREAIEASARIAGEKENQIVEPEHLLLALLDAREGVVEPVLAKAGADLTRLRADVAAAIDRRPKVSGAALGPQLSNAYRSVLAAAGREAEAMGDRFISTEHLLLALVDDTSPAAAALRDAGITREGLLGAIQAVRGSARVTDPNPEDKYQALEQYVSGGPRA